MVDEEVGEHGVALLRGAINFLGGRLAALETFERLGHFVIADRRRRAREIQRADLLETVVASGHIESPYRVEIASQITGTVLSVAVREGEVVRQGQPLILLRADELQNAAAQAQAAEAQAKARVRQVNELSLPQALEAERSAQASLLGTQQIYDRTNALLGKGFVTRAYFDEVTRNRDVAQRIVGL